MTKLRMKKLCGGCKAGGVWGHIAHCDLGAKVKTKYVHSVPVNGIPQEVCPKPMTNSLYCQYVTNGWRGLV